MKVCVIIPTYNEAKSIASLVKNIRNQNLNVAVIDDGSADNTEKKAKEEGAIVLKNDENQGKGAALIKGFDYALKNGFDTVICMDGDGQHLPEDIPLFLQTAKNTQSAIIIGNRMTKTKTMPWVRVITNKFMSRLISYVTKQNIPDSQCGFRLIKKELLVKMELTTLKYEIESEVLIKAARLGFIIASVPVKTVYRSENSRINPFIDTLRFFRYIIKELWTSQS